MRLAGTLVIGFCLLSDRAAAQAVPRFEDYPAAEVFGGQPAPPRLDTRDVRRFRTRLRDAAPRGPNFAGRFHLARWGCGAGCIFIAVIDSPTGQVWLAPFEVDTGWGVDGHVSCHHALQFNLTSELIIAQGKVLDKVGIHYFRWRDGKFTLVRTVDRCDLYEQ